MVFALEMSQIFPNSFCPGKLRKNHVCTEVQAPRIPMSAGEKEKQHSAGMGVWFRWARLISDTLTAPHLSTSQVVLLERLSRIFVQYSGSYILLSMCRFPLPCIPNTAIAMPAWTSSSNSWKAAACSACSCTRPRCQVVTVSPFPFFKKNSQIPHWCGLSKAGMVVWISQSEASFFRDYSGESNGHDK